MVKDENEKILWRGRPKFWPFVWKAFLLVPIGLLFAGVAWFIFAFTNNLFVLLLL